MNRTQDWPSGESMLSHVESLAHPYRDVLQRMLDPSTDTELERRLNPLFDRLFIAAIDYLELLERAELAGGTPCVLSEEHREAILECMLESAERGEPLSKIVDAKPSHTRACMEEAMQFLVQGEINVLERALALPPKQMHAFVHAFYGRLGPEQLAMELGKEVEDVVELVEGAVRRMHP